MRYQGDRGQSLDILFVGSLVMSKSESQTQVLSTQGQEVTYHKPGKSMGPEDMGMYITDVGKGILCIMSHLTM